MKFLSFIGIHARRCLAKFRADRISNMAARRHLGLCCQPAAVDTSDSYVDTAMVIELVEAAGA